MQSEHWSGIHSIISIYGMGDPKYKRGRGSVQAIENGGTNKQKLEFDKLIEFRLQVPSMDSS